MKREKCDAELKARIPEFEKNMAKTKAKLYGKTLSKWVRYCLENYIPPKKKPRS